jgi:hypothetical protein
MHLSSPEDRVRSLESWLHDAGISWDVGALRLAAGRAALSGPAIAVLAARDLQEGDQLCTIPKAACLSARTSSLAGVLEAEGIGGGLALVISVAFEMSLGAASKW